MSKRSNRDPTKEKLVKEEQQWKLQARGRVYDSTGHVNPFGNLDRVCLHQYQEGTVTIRLDQGQEIWAEIEVPAKLLMDFVAKKQKIDRTAETARVWTQIDVPTQFLLKNEKDEEDEVTLEAFLTPSQTGVSHFHTYTPISYVPRADLPKSYAFPESKKSH